MPRHCHIAFYPFHKESTHSIRPNNFYNLQPNLIGPVNNFTDASKSDMAKFAKWHREMLKRGIYLAPSQYEAGFTSLAHTEEDIDRTIQIAREVMAIL